MAHIQQINVSSGGVPKVPVADAYVTREGLRGDRQAKRGIHGGIFRAVSLFSADSIGFLAAQGHPIAPGTTGENLTVAGLDWSKLGPGTILDCGPEVRLKITSYALPCKTIAGSFDDGDFSRMHHRKHPGHSRLYAEVLIEGTVTQGDAVAIAAD